MAVEFLGKDPESEDGQSPTVLRDTVTGDYLLQGWIVSDEATLAEIGDIPASETVIRFPQRMLRYFPEVNGDGAQLS